jgi:hypothetical protein
MKKLRLQAEGLRVESFSTSSTDGQAGTVQGHEKVPTPPYICPVWSKPTDCPCTPIV